MKSFFLEFMLAVGSFITFSCIAEREAENIFLFQKDDAELLLQLRTPSGFRSAATRSLTIAQENSISDLYVLVFDRTGILTAIKKGGDLSVSADRTDSSYSGHGTFSVTLKASKTTEDKFNLVVLANAENIIQGTIGLDVSRIGDRTYSSVIAAVWKQISGPLHTAEGNIPMWGESGQIMIQSGSNSHTLQLTRSVARIDVGVGRPSKDGDTDEWSWDGLDKYGSPIPFELKNVYVVRANNRFSVASEPTATSLGMPTVPAGTTAFSLSDSKNAFGFSVTQRLPGGFTTRDIYIPETDVIMDASGTPGDANHNNRMALVVGGIYNNSGRETFYRIDFVVGGNLVNVLRNHLYQFNISEVWGDGYADVETAYNSLAINMAANIYEWDETNMGDVWFDGQYVLSVRPGSELEFYKNQGTQTIEVKTDYSGGWKIMRIAYPEGSTGSADWLSTDLTIGAQYGSDASYVPVNVSVTANNEGQERIGYIYINAGKLEGRITVTQSVVSPVFVKITDLSGNPVTALNFGPDNGEAGTPPAPQSFMVTWEPADRPLSISRVQTGVDPFSWQDFTSGLTTLPAGGVYTYGTIDPPAIPSSTPFLVRASVFVFTVADATGDKMASASISMAQRKHFSSITPFLTVTPPSSDYSYEGGTKEYQVTSYATATLADGGSVTGPVAWVAEFSTDGVTWNTVAPDWLLSFTTGGGSSTSVGAYPAEVAAFPSVETSPEDLALQAAGSKGTELSPYDLPTKGGSVSSNTANCYIVNGPGYFKLPLVYGNAIKDGAVKETAYKPSASNLSLYFLKPFVNHAGASITGPYIYTHATPFDAVLVWQDFQELVTSVKLIDEGKSLSFAVKRETIGQGNAVVAVRNVEKTILWSWHIWVTPASIFNAENPVTIAYDTNATYNFMEYNLGWCTPRETSYGTAPRSVQVRVSQKGVENALTDIFTITQKNKAPIITTGGNNPFWQWGRKDPMPPSNGISNTDKTFYCYNNYSFSSSTDKVTLGNAIQNPLQFYGNNGDWCSNGYLNLWSVENRYADQYDTSVRKTVYDPSPAGFAIPPLKALSGLVSTSVNGSFDKGLNFNLAFGGTTFYPAAGRRTNGTGAATAGVTTSGDYWMSTPPSAFFELYNSKAYSFNFTGTNPTTNSNNSRSYGFSVRCVKE